jgi:hypothetical protein
MWNKAPTEKVLFYKLLAVPVPYVLADIRVV